MNKKVLLKHNEDLYEQIRETLNTKNKALVVLGTVLGKTTTALQYLIDYNYKGLVIVPNKLIKNGWESYSDLVDVITYQSFANRYKNIDFSKYDLFILDEAHHIGYNETSKIGAKIWSKGIRYLMNNNYKVLGLTATPDRSDGIKLEEELFKDCICEGYSVEDGIEKGIIHPFSYVTAIYNTSEIVKQTKEKYYNDEDEESRKLFGQLDLAINNTPTIKEIFEKYMPKDSKRKGIVFIQAIEDKQYVLNLLNNIYPNAEIRAIDSKMNSSEVKKNRNWFKNVDEGYLLAVNMISEGAHYKGVNTIIMFRRTNSYLLYTQQLGRIMTLTKDENPNGIVFDLVNNIDNIQIKEKTFKGQKLKKYNISSIINSLKNLKSDQIIIADETQDIVKKLKEIKKYNSRFWTDEEIQILKDNYGKKPIEEISEMLNNKYSYASIICLANRMNLSQAKNRWTDEEIQILKDNYNKLNKEELSKLLNRSIKAILNKLLSLGLVERKLNKWTDEEIQILKDNYNKLDEEKLVKLLNNHPYKEIKRKARDLNISLRSKWKWTEEEMQILKDNFNKVDKKELVKLLNNKFSFDAIRKKAKLLNLKNKHYYTWNSEDIQILKNNYEKINMEELIKLLNNKFSNKQIINKINELKENVI